MISKHKEDLEMYGCLYDKMAHAYKYIKQVEKKGEI